MCTGCVRVTKDVLGGICVCLCVCVRACLLGKAVQWFEQQNDNFEDIMEFTQEAEDLVLLPNFWSHATLNLEASVGFAFEFEYTPW